MFGLLQTIIHLVSTLVCLNLQNGNGQMIAKNHFRVVKVDVTVWNFQSKSESNYDDDDGNDVNVSDCYIFAQCEF